MCGAPHSTSVGEIWDLHEALESRDAESVVRKFAHGEMPFPTGIKGIMVRMSKE